MSGYTDDYDVIVVGAGPAGSTAAQTAANAGFRVLLLEKNASCKKPCAGYISNTINLELPDYSAIQSKIIKMRTYFPDLSFHDFQLNGFVVDRPRFDTALLENAKEAGASVKLNSPLVNFIPEGIKFQGGKAKGKIIAGADGVFSKTASLLGLEKQKIAACAQYHMEGIKPLPETGEIFFNAEYAPGGYVWIYPTAENSAKVGLGTTRSNSPRRQLDAFISNVSPHLNGRISEYITGSLPVSGLREKLCYGNVLLAGDSAGMADPITGAGINNALLAGEMAGNTIINALESDDIANLSRYEVKIKKLLAKPFRRSLEKRKKLEACADNESLSKHLPEFWVTFKQYWV